MALRQTVGFVESLLKLIGLDWAVPDFSTLSRRQKTLAVNIPYRGSKGGRAHETKLCGRQNILGGRSGETGAAITAEAASRARCIV